MKQSSVERPTRWALRRPARQKAQSIFADYQDLVQGGSGPGGCGLPGRRRKASLPIIRILCRAGPARGVRPARSLGGPQDVAGLLTDSRSYTVWLGAFVLLSLCAPVPCPAGVNSAVRTDHMEGIGFGPSAVGTIGVPVWFRRHKKERQAPRALFPVLGGLAAWCVSLLFFSWL